MIQSFQFLDLCRQICLDRMQQCPAQRVLKISVSSFMILKHYCICHLVNKLFILKLPRDGMASGCPQQSETDIW